MCAGSAEFPTSRPSPTASAIAPASWTAVVLHRFGIAHHRTNSVPKNCNPPPWENQCISPARPFPEKSGRRLPQSKTWRSSPTASVVAPASWTAVALYRFAMTHHRTKNVPKTAIPAPWENSHIGPARPFPEKSGRGLPQSTTSRHLPAASDVAGASWTAVVFYRFAMTHHRTKNVLKTAIPARREFFLLPSSFTLHSPAGHQSRQTFPAAPTPTVTPTRPPSLTAA